MSVFATVVTQEETVKQVCELYYKICTDFFDQNNKYLAMQLALGCC